MAGMDEEVITLLREIRDLQKLHFENYKDALSNQKAAMEMQRKANRLQKRAMLVLFLFAVFLIALLLLPAFTRH